VNGRVLLVDDDPAVLRSTAAVLRHHGFEVDCHASARTALAALANDRPDVLITDLHLPERSGLDLLRDAHEHGELASIVITGQPDVASAVDALRLSAVDYVLKPLDPLDLVKRTGAAVDKARARRRVSDARREVVAVAGMLDALREVLDGPGPIAPSQTGEHLKGGVLRGLSAHDRELLSAREIEVVERMVEGNSPKEIASALFISPHTVRNHLRSIYSKLGVHTQVELLRKVVG